MNRGIIGCLYFMINNVFIVLVWWKYFVVDILVEIEFNFIGIYVFKM